jgi:hypothetical protein
VPSPPLRWQQCTAAARFFCDARKTNPTFIAASVETCRSWADLLTLTHPVFTAAAVVPKAPQLRPPSDLEIFFLLLSFFLLLPFFFKKKTISYNKTKHHMI